MYGKYLGHVCIYIYVEYIMNIEGISTNMHKKSKEDMSRNKERRPNGAAVEGGVSVFFVSAHFIFLLYIFMDIP